MKNINHNHIILSIILALFIIIVGFNLKKNKTTETFLIFGYDEPFYKLSPSTRNMSYDLRCEPRIPKTNNCFKNSAIELPHQYKCLEMI